MVRLVVLLVAVILTVGAGLFGLVHFGVVPDITGMIKPPETEANAPPPPPPRVDPVFMAMDPILVPVIRDGDIKQNVYISFKLELVPEQGARSKAYFHRVVLRDTYVRALYEMIPEQLAERDVLDVGAVKARLMDLTQRIIGPGVVKDVVMVAVFYR